MRPYLYFLIPAFLFLFLKLTSLGIRFSDTNIYFYTAYSLLQGKMLYKDIFFTNFPLFMYVSSFYHLISGGSILFYYFTAILESIGTAFLIYLIVYKQCKRVDLSLISSTMYLFSYLILATSDHQTGVFLASFFATLSYYFFEKKNYLFTGVFVACALLTKAYFLPILIAYLFVLPWRTHFKQILNFFSGGGGTTILILLPTLLFSFNEFYADIITYSLIRPQGIPKGAIFNALLTREFFLFGIGLTSILFFKKYRFVAILFITMTLLFIFYKDFYFYYFNIAAPFFCIFFAYLYTVVEKSFKMQRFVIPTFLFLVICLNISQYFSTARNQTITNYEEIVATIKKLHPSSLYGANDITPLLAYSTQTPLLNGIIDTNPTIFRKGILRNTTLTKEAISQKALLIGHGIYYPEYNIRQDFIDEIFDQALLTSNCTLVGNFPIKTEGYTNRLQFVQCQ